MSKYKMPDDLYPYQREDADRIMDEDRNWLLTHQMGVGKTPITLRVIEAKGYNIPLIICPNSIRFEWARQIGEWTEESAAISKQNIYIRLGEIVRSLTKVDGPKYKIINYETLRNKENRELLEMIPFDCIVFDEIHKLRNPKTQLTKSVWEFLEHFPDVKIMGLSGSPIMNYPNDLYVPLSICYPKKYKRDAQNWRYFMYKYCLFNEGRFGSYIYGTQHLSDLRAETKDLMIRRTKEEVLPFLPEKYYQRPELPMKDDQRYLYDQMIKELRILLDTGEPLWSTNILSRLTRLRQLNLDPKIVGVTASSAKTEFLYDLVESTDEKVVIFSTFESYIEYLHEVYTALGLKHAVVTGRVAPDKRAGEVKMFQEDDECRLFLATIQAAGEGITLTASSTVVMMDRWWNEPTNQQAIDRLHRIGQKNAVQVVIPLCLDSVDETLDEILQRKNQASSEYYSEQQVREGIFNSILGRAI